MKAAGLKLVLIGFLAIAANTVFAQVGALHDAKLDQQLEIEDPALAAKVAEGGWLAFSIPQLQTQRSPCCWKGKWGAQGEAGCELQKSHQSYGTRDDSPIEDQVIVFNQIKNGVVTSTLVAGESCPVDAAGAAVTWIGSVDDQAGLEWLAKSAEQDDSALYAVGLHRSEAATTQLVSMAKSNINDELSEQAVFWLGEARGQQGFEALKQLLEQLPAGETRKHINFALAQNDSPEAADLLVEISGSDRDAEQRSDALFWLAQGYPQLAAPILIKFVHAEHDEDALEQAVFAISQLGEESGDKSGDKFGDKILMDLARDQQVSRVVRRQALFWLAQSDNDETVAALAQLLSN